MIDFPIFRKKYCLVLGGGGTKGIYEFGVWTALKEMRITLEAVIGTSIGAVNGMWMVQNDYEKAKSTWNSIQLKDILKIPDNFQPPKSENSDLKTFELLWRVLRRQGKLDSSPLKKMVHDQIRPEVLRKAKLDFGIITFNASKLGPDIVFARETPPGKLADYLMASTTFPGFTPTKIGKNTYLDGGLYDNVPVETARTRGYRRLIVVDVGGVGFHRNIDPWGGEAIYIRNSENLGHVLDFRPEFLWRYKTMGYLDTLKAFSRLEGETYYLRREKGWYRTWERILRSDDFSDSLPANLTPWERCLPHKFRFYKVPSRFLLEAAAEALEIERMEVYTPRQLTGLVLEKYSDLIATVDAMDLPHQEGLFGALQSEWKHPRILPGLGKKAPMEADLILTRLGFHRTHPMIMDLLHGHYPKLRAAKLFLYLASMWSGGNPSGLYPKA